MEIVSLSENHLDEAAILERKCFSLPWSRESLQREIQNASCRYLAAVEDGKLIGYAGMQSVLDEGYINNIATAPEFRRRGVASALISELISHAEYLSLAFLTLEVRESNAPAIALYRKFGFTEVGRRKAYYEKPREDAVLMTIFLNKEQ